MSDLYLREKKFQKINVLLLITRFLRFYIPEDCRLIYYILSFCTVVAGSAMYGYSKIPRWDKLFHFFSDILFSDCVKKSPEDDRRPYSL